MLIFTCLLLPGIIGCQMTKEWVITTATDIAAKAVDSQIEKVNQNYIVPQIARVEEKLGQKVDKNGDGLWTADEISAAIRTQMTPALQETVTTLTADSDQKLSDRLKDLPTKGDNMKGLLTLVVLWVLTKLGVKVGPKGIQSVKSWVASSNGQPTTPNL